MIIVVVSLAALLRWPNLLLVPAMTDESREVALALAILHDGARPLIGADAYNGPLYQYLLAAAMQVFGVSIGLPRLFVLAVGTLTVAATYGFVRVWRGPLAATIAALLMAFSGVHVIVNSHVAWSNNTTPLFTTLALIPLALAHRSNRPRLLPAGGLLLGLALQTHPTVWSLVAGVVVWVGIEYGRAREGWSRSRGALLLGLALMLASYANVLLYNLRTLNDPANSIAAASRRTYAFSLVSGPAEYAERFGTRILELARMLAPAFPAYPEVGRYLEDPFVAGAVLVTILALVYAWRRTVRLPAVVVAATLVLFPILSRRYNFPLESRYLVFLLPLCYAAVGIMAGDLLTGLVRAARSGGRGWGTNLAAAQSLPAAGVRWMAAGALLALIVAWCLHAWVGVNGYYSFFLARGPNNVTLLRLVAETQGTGQLVWIDRGLSSGYWLGAGAEVGEALSYLFTLAGTRYRFVEEEQALGPVPQGSIVILTAEHAREWAAPYRLTPFDLGPPPAEATSILGRYAAYRVGGP